MHYPLSYMVCAPALLFFVKYAGAVSSHLCLLPLGTLISGKAVPGHHLRVAWVWQVPFPPSSLVRRGVLFLTLSGRGRVLLFEGTSDCPKVKLTCCYYVSSLTGKELDPVVKKVWWGTLWTTLGEIRKRDYPGFRRAEKPMFLRTKRCLSCRQHAL